MKLKENMRRFNTKNLNEQTAPHYSKCDGEVFGSDICGNYEMIVHSIVNQIADSCNCFQSSFFTSWDKEGVKAALKTLPPGLENELQELLYCYMKGAPDSEFKDLKPSDNPLNILTKEL